MTEPATRPQPPEQGFGDADEALGFALMNAEWLEARVGELMEELRVTQSNLDLLTPIVDSGGQLERLEAALRDINEPYSSQTQAAVIWLAEALDADRVRLANLETKTAHLPFPAAPEPGA